MKEQNRYILLLFFMVFVSDDTLFKCHCQWQRRGHAIRQRLIACMCRLGFSHPANRRVASVLVHPYCLTKKYIYIAVTT